MSFAQPWPLCFAAAALLLVLGAASGQVNARAWFSEPMACLAFGIAVGPALLGWMRLEPMTDPAASAFLREAARVTLGIAVLAAAMRLPHGWLLGNWRGMAVALGPGMALMWAAGTLAARYALGLPWTMAALLGAIVSPTDPVLSAPVVGGALARHAVPESLRHAITAESAVNDGSAGPLVMLPLLALQGGPGWGGAPDIGDWLLREVVLRTGGAVLLGALAGYGAGLLLNWANRQAGSERSSLLTIALALALATLGGLETIGCNGVLGAFAAGAMLNRTHDGDVQEHQEHFNEAITRFFDLPIVMLLGVAIPWAEWRHLGWRGAAFAAGLLLLRRLPAWALLRLAAPGAMPWARRWPEVLFVGWFGPIGAAAMFYALDAGGRVGLGVLWPAVSLAACASVVAHGATGTHFSRRLGGRGLPA